MAPDVAREGASPVIRSIELDDGRRIIARPATYDDVPGVYDLYARLSREDLGRRFFTPRMPSPERVEHWVSPDRGGAALVAELVDGNGPVIVGEAGYSLLADGDGELAITVDADYRGGLGTWLLGVLVDVAADRGVPNLHADVLLLNRPMLAMLRRRSTATVEHPDVGQVRLVIGTGEPTPGWPAVRTRPRLLVEGVRGMWWGEQLASDAGFDMRICPGPLDDADRCPVLCGDACPLVDGADVVLSSFPPDHPYAEEIVDRLRRTRPDTTVVVAGDEFDVAETAFELIDDLRAEVDDG